MTKLKQQQARSLLSEVAVALGVAWLGGCASVPAPTEQMAVSRAAVQEAVSAGGTELAPVEMRAAQDKLVRAAAAMAGDDNVLAARLAEEAEVDARLAAARARSEKAQRAVAELRESIRALQQEIGRRPQ
jgi:hypothetical protein